MLNGKRTVRTLLSVVIAGFVATAPLTSTAANAAPSTSSPGGTQGSRTVVTADFWACSPVAGFTWDRVVNQLGVCNPSGFAFSYHIVSPADGLLVCSPVAGFTWDVVANNLGVCNPSGFAFSYRIRVPVNGLWACSIPPGWAYDAVANNLGVCDPSGFAFSYRLIH